MTDRKNKGPRPTGLNKVYTVYDTAEEEKPEFTYFDAFIHNLGHNDHVDILAICLILRFASTSFKMVISYKL